MLGVVLVEGDDLDEEQFSRMDGKQIACGCFRCGRRIAIHLGQLAMARLKYKGDPTLITCCTECKEGALDMRIGDDGADGLFTLHDDQD